MTNDPRYDGFPDVYVGPLVGLDPDGGPSPGEPSGGDSSPPLGDASYPDHDAAPIGDTTGHIDDGCTIAKGTVGLSPTPLPPFVLLAMGLARGALIGRRRHQRTRR